VLDGARSVNSRLTSGESSASTERVRIAASARRALGKGVVIVIVQGKSGVVMLVLVSGVVRDGAVSCCLPADLVRGFSRRVGRFVDDHSYCRWRVFFSTKWIAGHLDVLAHDVSHDGDVTPCCASPTSPDGSETVIALLPTTTYNQKTPRITICIHPPSKLDNPHSNNTHHVIVRLPHLLPPRGRLLSHQTLHPRRSTPTSNSSLLRLAQDASRRLGQDGPVSRQRARDGQERQARHSERAEQQRERVSLPTVLRRHFSDHGPMSYPRPVSASLNVRWLENSLLMVILDRAKSKGEGGHAAHEGDERGSVKKAKDDMPEAPDTAIGFQDERGGKGHS